MVTLSDTELFYLIRKANTFGIKGTFIRDFKLPTSATQNITDTLWVVENIDHMDLAASDTPPWERG